MSDAFDSAPPAELAELYERERELPPVSVSQRERIFARVSATVGTGGGGGGLSGLAVVGLLVLALGAGTGTFLIARALFVGVGGGNTTRPAADDDHSLRRAREVRLVSSGRASALERHRVAPKLVDEVPAESMEPDSAHPSGSTASGEDTSRTSPPWFGQRNVPPRRIAGRVTFDGRPAAGAAVALESILTAADRSFERSVTTGPDGAFDFGPQAPWTYLVSATMPGRSPAVVKVAINNPLVVSDALLLELGGCDVEVEGTVTDSFQRGIGWARVRRIENWFNGPYAQAGLHQVGERGESDGDGRFRLCARLGSFKLRVEADGYGTRIVAVAAIAPRTRADVQLLPESVVEGVVVRGETGKPIPHVQVAMWPNGKDRPAPDVVPVTALTDGEGRFQVRGLAPNRYVVSAWAPDATSREPLEVDVKAGAVERGLVRRLYASATVRVRVSSGGAPLAGVRVALHREDVADSSSYPAFTQLDGTVTIHGVTPGANEITVPGHRVLTPKRADVALDDGDVIAIEVEPVAPKRQP